MRASLAALTAAVIVLLFVSLRGGAQSLQHVPLASGMANSPIVAELFTSQSCSSCPPAEKLFAELAERPDLIVLEWHVDYWDRLVHGRAGAWKDPYSNREYTARQRQYNRALRGTAGVYTPQAVINGTQETVGNHRRDVESLLRPTQHATAHIKVSNEGDQLRIDIQEFVSDLDREADILQLTLLPGQTTAVPRGENRGAILASKNVVLGAVKIGAYRGAAISLRTQRPPDGETCAIIIQEKRGAQLGPIIGASYCN